MKRYDKFLLHIISPRTAVVLLVLLAVICISSMFVPQRLDGARLPEGNERSGAGFIRFFHLDDVFTGWPFLLVVSLFFLNLTGCSLRRFLRELRRRGIRRHGPDLLHLGLMLLCVGAVVSALSGSESPTVWMRPGDVVGLPGGGDFRLLAFEIEWYTDGSPKNWISAGEYTSPDGEVHRLRIGVNRPARISGIRIFQDRYHVDRAGGGGETTGLRISRRRGLPVVFTSFTAIMVGMVMILLEKRSHL